MDRANKRHIRKTTTQGIIITQFKTIRIKTKERKYNLTNQFIICNKVLFMECIRIIVLIYI